MKSAISLVVALTALASQSSAHLLTDAERADIFERFTHGGTLYPVYQYIRPNTNMNSPVIDLTSTDTRCNVGANGSATDTITVAAGDAFSFTSDVAVYHDGPLSIYMAKAPAAAKDFDGSGQVWFKILDIGPTFDSSGTATWNLAQTYTYNIPTALPSGDYILRIQQLAIHNPYPAGTPQFYIECAQITVTGGGTGTPGPLVSIPGWIDGTEPGYVVNIYNDFHNYTVPGPAVWAGQNA
ncbi:putative endo-beta-1,4-glucanase D [Lachnellula subtilissima]|uniref:AA9 family lytic polysaccharide monooxygenase n=1 Tax=Lachnellula subtilissima TaxID=602034 RepID=A0A8H8RV99_9HELO|nr:putative endo-beta-1,4-glucanase D [Lachnellula subtilissima]